MATMSSRVQPIYNPGAIRPEQVAPIARPERGARLTVARARQIIAIALCLAVIPSTYLAGLTLQYRANYQRAALQEKIRSLQHRNQELRLMRDAAKQAARADDWAVAQGMVQNVPSLVLRERAR